MAGYMKINGVWSPFTPWVKVAGVWKLPKRGLVKFGSYWRAWWLDTGATDTPAFNLTDTEGGFVGTVYHVSEEADGRLLFSGNHDGLNGIGSIGLCRTTASGVPTTDFQTFFDDRRVYKTIIQPDGKILVGHESYYWNGSSTSRGICRLLSTGALDTTFQTNVGNGFGQQSTDIALQADGKILIVGYGTWNNGATAYTIVRLNATGTLDTAFQTAVGTGLSGWGYSLALQSDGKILIGGSFANFNGDATKAKLVRLNLDGTVDATFATPTFSNSSDYITRVKVLTNGKILICGRFTTVNGVASATVAQLNADGSLDTAFSALLNGGGGSNTTNDLAIQSTGKIVLVGNWTTFAGQSRPYLCRLNADGSFDSTFSNQNLSSTDATISYVAGVNVLSSDRIAVSGNWKQFGVTNCRSFAMLTSTGAIDNTFINYATGFDGAVHAVHIQSNGKIIFGGKFQNYGTTPAPRLIRFNTDGSIDTSFLTAIGSGPNTNGPDNAVDSIAEDSSGRLIIGGSFTLFNGITARGIARLLSTGAKDSSFTLGTTNSQVSKVIVDNDGNYICMDYWGVRRLNANNTLGFSITNSNSVNDIAVTSSNQIIVVGGFNPFISTSTAKYIVCLNSDGTENTTFTANTGTGFSAAMNQVKIDGTGKIIVAGRTATYSGITASLFRLDANGFRDTTFAGLSLDWYGATASLEVLEVLQDGSLITGGLVTSQNQTIFKLWNDGSVDTKFKANLDRIYWSNVTDKIVMLKQDPVSKKVFVVGDFGKAGSINRTRVTVIQY